MSNMLPKKTNKGEKKQQLKMEYINMNAKDHASKGRISNGHAVQVRTRVSESEFAELQKYADDQCLSLSAITRIIFMKGIEQYRTQQGA